MHPVLDLSRDEPGQDGLKNSSSVANGIKMLTAKGTVGEGHLLEGLQWGFWLSMGGLTG